MEALTFGAHKNMSIRNECTTYMLTNTGRRLIEYTRFICTADDARITRFNTMVDFVTNLILIYLEYICYTS